MNKFKCHKISNIEKSICTCEQKIAYNFAFMWFETGKKILNSNMFEVGKSEAFADIERSVSESLKAEEFKKYNKDVILIAFRQGFRDYCNNFFIAAEYAQVGKVFTIPYEII